jgi:predicted transposase YbfD/YdcC
LKANRPLQHAGVRAWFADPANRPDGEHTTTDADNGRIEVRRHERRFYLSSAPLDATAFVAAVRAHWRIENCLHWVLDVGFDEDRPRNRKDHGPENLSILRKLTLNVLRTARPDISIRRKVTGPDRPTSSPDLSSVKCDSPGASVPRSCGSLPERPTFVAPRSSART